MLLLMLALSLEAKSIDAASVGMGQPSMGRRTEEEARALAAVFTASPASSFASFHALIFTAFLALVAHSA